MLSGRALAAQAIHVGVLGSLTNQLLVLSSFTS